MTRGRWLTLLVVGVVATLLALIFGSQGKTAGPSVLSAGADGWQGMYAYLRARDVSTHLLDQPLDRLEENGEPERGEAAVLVTSFPWQRALLDPRPLEAYRRFALRGGTLLVAYSGREAHAQEQAFLDALGLEPRSVRPATPLGPLAWRRHIRETWDLQPEAGLSSGARPVRIRAPELVPDPAALGQGEVGGARPLYRGETPVGNPPTLAFWVPYGQGRLVVLPADALANGWLSEPGNADLLESLASWLGDEWIFDEYSHGLLSEEVVREIEPPVALDLFLIHLVVLYLLAVFALMRRFGPPWREPPVRVGSAGSFLSGLGALHHRLGHHRQAAELLVERSRRQDPRLDLPSYFDSRAAAVDDGPALVALAHEIAEARGATRRDP